MSVLTMQELLALLTLFSVYLLPIILVMVLRNYYPNRLMIGMLLCLYSSAGHFYLPGGAISFLLVCSLYRILGNMTGHTLTGVLIVHGFSAWIFCWRFQRRQERSLVFQEIGS